MTDRAQPWVGVSQVMRLAVSHDQVVVPVGPVRRVRLPAASKTAASARSIDLDASTTAALRRHRARQAEERLAALGAWTGTWCSAGRTGSAIHPQTVTYWFQRAARAAGLPVIPLHGLRHSYATAALEAGIPAKLVQERLGHSSIRVTLDTYTHPSDAMARKAAEDVAALLFGGPGGRSGTGS